MFEKVKNDPVKLIFLIIFAVIAFPVAVIAHLLKSVR